MSSLEALLAKAATSERESDWSSALHWYEQAYLTAAQRQDVGVLLDVLIKLGHCHRKAGKLDLATENFELAVEIGSRSKMDHLISRAINGLGMVAQSRGGLSEAASLYERALLHAERADAFSVAGDAQQNLGVIANIRGDLPEALRRYTLGIALFERAENLNGVGSALNNLGMLHVDLGRLDEADAYFERALDVSRDTNNALLDGIVSVNRAELFLARGDLASARDSCDRGFEIFSRLGDLANQAEALKYYGIIYQKSGKPHLAVIHLQRAIEISATRDPLLEAEAQRELALVFREQGKNREALAALNRSHTLFRALQAERETTDIQQRIERLEEDFLMLVQQWGESIEAKDHYTVGHCQRVADYACRLAECVGIAPHEMVWFRMGAFLHDLGKIEVPADVLNKPGRLTDEERALMERHPVTGEAMLGSVDFPWDIRPMVRSHHERWGGGGYPDQLEGEAIPFSARILRVADVFDALTTARSYRRPLTPIEAMAIMEEDRGSFDPSVFAAFVKLFPEFSVAAMHADSEGD